MFLENSLNSVKYTYVYKISDIVCSEFEQEVYNL